MYRWHENSKCSKSSSSHIDFDMLLIRTISLSHRISWFKLTTEGFRGECIYGAEKLHPTALPYLKKSETCRICTCIELVNCADRNHDERLIRWYNSAALKKGLKRPHLKTAWSSRYWRRIIFFDKVGWFSKWSSTVLLYNKF